MMAVGRRGIVGVGSMVLFTGLLGPAGAAAPLDGAALVAALRQGGFVLVMRHANAPANPPAQGAADPENTGRERQLDAAGRTSVAAMGAAFRRLGIPVGQVWCSPTYRTRETVRLAGFGAPVMVAELNEGGKGMNGGADEAGAAWLRAKVAEAPKPGTNAVIVTHMPNIVGAFGAPAAGVEAGEALVFRAGGSGKLVARVKIGAWGRFGL